MDPRGISIQPQGGREAGLKATALALTPGEAWGRVWMETGEPRPGALPGCGKARGCWALTRPLHPRTVEHSLHMFDRMVIYFFIAASYAPW